MFCFHPPIAHYLAIFCLFLSSYTTVVEQQEPMKCFTCAGFCNCRDEQKPEVCHQPNSHCYTLKAVFTGQVFRRGCAPNCALPQLGGWQQCQLCQGPLCNNSSSPNSVIRPNFPAVDECEMEKFVARLQLRNGANVRSPYQSDIGFVGQQQNSQPGFLAGGFPIPIPAQFLNGIDSSRFGQENLAPQALEPMSSSQGVPIGFEANEIQPYGQPHFGVIVQPPPTVAPSASPRPRDIDTIGNVWAARQNGASTLLAAHFFSVFAVEIGTCILLLIF